MDRFSTLPPECVSHIISLTSPRDACRLTVVSPVIKSIANSDTVWERFLPSDYQEILSNSVSSSSLLTSLFKKDLYFHLCYNPTLINNATMTYPRKTIYEEKKIYSVVVPLFGMSGKANIVVPSQSFALEKESGKKCYMVGARELSIAWGDNPTYWIWISLPESRFPEVAELQYVWWFEVKGKIETNILSSKTTYAAYLVFKFGDSRFGFDIRPMELGVYIEGSDNEERRQVLLDPPANMPQPSQDRRDGWMEIEMGEFFNVNGDDGTLVCSAFNFDSINTMSGIIVQGIEFRPKNG